MSGGLPPDGGPEPAHPDDPGPAAPAEDGGARGRRGDGPWVETREGAYFFVNGLLVMPELVILVPLGLKGLLSLFGAGGESVYLDTFPMLAGYVLPWAGWLLVVPIWTTLRNLRMELPGGARLALRTMLLSHVGFLAWTVWHWVGGGG